ncbi:MAG: hypothetical protein J0M12_06065 [Deltaproteobacteria bacterium]|nr:hypothetical protein [Deltaproteobacteria bacterium]
MHGSTPSSHHRNPSPAPQSPDPVALAKELLTARREANSSSGDWAKVATCENAILALFGVKPDKADTVTFEALDSALRGTPALTRECLACAFLSKALSKSGFDDNRYGQEAFALAERAVHLNPTNPEHIRTLWTILRKNQRTDLVPVSRSELDREITGTIAAFERYLVQGACLLPPDFSLPDRWKEKAENWRKAVAFSLENYATMSYYRSVELRKRSASLDDIVELQTKAERATCSALILCNAPWNSALVDGLARNDNDPHWKNIASGQEDRVARCYRTISLIASKQNRRTADYERYDAAARMAEHKARLAQRPSRDQITIEHLLSTNFLGLPIQLPSGAPAPVDGEARPASPPQGVILNSKPREPAPKSPGAAEVTPTAWASARAPAAPSAQFTTWADFARAVHNQAFERLSLDQIEKLGSRVTALKLPNDVPEKDTLAAVGRSSTYAAAASLRPPSVAAGLLVLASSEAIARADSELDVPSLLELLAVRGAILAFTKRNSGGMDRSAKVSLDRQLPLLQKAAQELGEMLQCERQIPRLNSVFEMVTMPSGRS